MYNVLLVVPRKKLIKRTLKHMQTLLWISLLICAVIISLFLFSSRSNEKYEDGTNRAQLLKLMKNFHWNGIIQALEDRNVTSFSLLAGTLLVQLAPYLAKEPLVPINVTCKPPPLVFPPPPAAPYCRNRVRKRKVGILLQLGFDADTLEIHFHELDSVVDYFFILESIRSHYIGVRKPLLWEVLQRQKRFSKFLPKVVHFVVDDSDIKPLYLRKYNAGFQLTERKRFSIAYLQERERWKKFLKWNNFTKYFGKDDILGFGDADEIPYRNAVYYLKHCELPSNPLSVGMWVPFGKLDQLYRSKWPVPGYPFSHVGVTFWTFEKANATYSKGSYPTNLHGGSRSFISGGTHMTHYGYVPFQIAQQIASSSAVPEKIITFASMFDTLTEKKFEEIENYLATIPKKYKQKLRDVPELKREFPDQMNHHKHFMKLPWYYLCNAERYPLWHGNHDTRLD